MIKGHLSNIEYDDSYYEKVKFLVGYDIPSVRPENLTLEWLELHFMRNSRLNYHALNIQPRELVASIAGSFSSRCLFVFEEQNTDEKVHQEEVAYQHKDNEETPINFF